MGIKKKWVLLIVSLLGCYMVFQSTPRNEKIKVSNFLNDNRDRPLVIAHGGAKKLYPENTIYAFNQVYNMNVDAIEVDVRMSKDLVLCSIHDEYISHYTNKKGRVQEYTYRELSSFNFGYYFKDSQGEYFYRDATSSIKKQLIPMRIEQMFFSYQKEILYILEIKEVGKRGLQCANKLYELIKKYNLEEYVCVASFDDEILDYFKRISNHEITISKGYRSVEKFNEINYMEHDFNKDGLLLPLDKHRIGLDDRHLIDTIHQNQKFVFYWTINDKEQMEMLIEKKVDGIISDRPDLLLDIINKSMKEGK